MTLSGNLPSYYLDLYGDNTIAWVPPVSNYLYFENISKRGINDREFRWEEAIINLTGVQSGALIDFTMPDYYMLQFTPDLGWHDMLSMFGENVDGSIHNPHLQNIGPFSITNGTLEDNADNSVTATLTTGQMEQAVIDGYSKYLWRAVPWADGNPGYGGLPSAFEWVASIDQLKFVVDTIVKEKSKSTQTVSGTKGPRVTITVESENNPTVFIEQTSTTWKVIFAIDRPRVKFTIVATDIGGTAIGKYNVDLSFEADKQMYIHSWNNFDSFALLASLVRLPEETNDSLRDRTIDAFKNKGGSHYAGLAAGINRELGLKRKDNAIQIKRKKNESYSVYEKNINIESFYNRLSIGAESFVIYDEIQTIDSYTNLITVNKRIAVPISVKTESNQEIDSRYWDLYSSIDNIDGNTIYIDPKFSGIVKVTYAYKEDLLFSNYPDIASLANGIRNVETSLGYNILECTIDGTMSGSEKCKNLYKAYIEITDDNPVYIGWSPVGIYSVADQDYKWSFASSDSTFFNSEFYRYVVQLKSSTNIEWGSVVIDEDYWDAFDSNWYGKDSLPLAFDISLSKYTLSIPKNTHASIFDSYEALRMNYYYEKSLLTNAGFPQSAFRSGVGYKKDCVVGFVNKSITSAETRINFNPFVLNSSDIVDFGTSANDIAINI